jgi:hypothetical protein
VESEELHKALLAKDYEVLKGYVSGLLNPDPDRALILAAHLVIEQLLGDMIAPSLPHPNIWLDESDFRSRVNLARALGSIGDKELRICRVIGAARNAAAHTMGPLPEKWRTEMERLAFGKKATRQMPEPSFRETVHELLVPIVAPWLYVRFRSNHQLLRENHKDRWLKLVSERLSANPELAALVESDPKNPALEALINEVDLIIAREQQVLDAGQ